jgi:hypothetical protein
LLTLATMVIHRIVTNLVAKMVNLDSSHNYK